LAASLQDKRSGHAAANSGFYHNARTQRAANDIARVRESRIGVMHGSRFRAVQKRPLGCNVLAYGIGARVVLEAAQVCVRSSISARSSPAAPAADCGGEAIPSAAVFPGQETRMDG